MGGCGEDEGLGDGGAVEMTDIYIMLAAFQKHQQKDGPFFSQQALNTLFTFFSVNSLSMSSFTPCDLSGNLPFEAEVKGRGRAKYVDVDAAERRS